MINLENRNINGKTATRLLARLAAVQSFNVNSLFGTCALGPTEPGPRFYPLMEKLIKSMLKDPGPEAEIFKTLDAAKELLQAGKSPDDKSNGSARTGNSSDDKSNGSDDKSNGSAGTGNSSDDKSNGSARTGNGSDDKSNGSARTGNSSDDKSNGSAGPGNSSDMNRSTFAVI